MTRTPAAANRGACAREVVAPAEKIATSRPVGSAVSASSTTICSPSKSMRGAGAARAGEEAELGDREVALVEQAAHDGADLSGGADDAEAQGCVMAFHGTGGARDVTGAAGTAERSTDIAHR